MRDEGCVGDKKWVGITVGSSGKERKCLEEERRDGDGYGCRSCWEEVWKGGETH